MSKRKYNDISLWIEELLCSVCQELPRVVPVSSCPDGHLICSECLPQLEKNNCPLCRKILTGENNNTVAGALILKIPHPCKYSDNGCTESLLLSNIIVHEKECLYKPMKCGECKKDIAINNFDTHFKDCLTNDNDVHYVYAKKSVIKRFYRVSDEYVSWDGKGNVNYHYSCICWRPDLVYYDGKKFYLGARWDCEKKLFFFYACIQGNDADCSNYEVLIILNNTEGKEIAKVYCDISSVAILYDFDKIEASGACVPIQERLMEKIFLLGEEKWIKFEASWEVVKVEPCSK